jgi:putative endonuclease
MGLLGCGWCVYIIECFDGTLYTGVTNDLAKRISLHKQGKAAKYTKPVHRRCRLLAYVEPAPDRSTAQKREVAIKKLTRKGKLDLILTQCFRWQLINRRNRRE